MKNHSIFKKFLASKKAGVAIMMGAGLPVLLIIAGVALEMSRVSYVESKLAFAADAACVAGARYDINDVEKNALDVFNANFVPGTFGLSPTPVITYDPITEIVRVKVNDVLPTMLAQLIGIKTLTVAAESQVKREFGGLELAMVLDVTGSMAGNNKIGGLRTAAKALIDVIYEGKETRRDTAIGLVPFVTVVNIGTNNTSWLTDPATLTKFPSEQPWEGCVMANSYGEFDDESFDTLGGVGASKWPTYFVESTVPNPDDCVQRDNDWILTTSPGSKRRCPPKAPSPGVAKFDVLTTVSGVNIGPNRSCPIPMMPLHNSSSELKAYIDTLSATNGGGTMGNIGLVWGGRMLSEVWDGAWTVKQANGSTIVGESIKAYTEPTNTKAIIMMTDGGSNWYNGVYSPSSDPTSYGTAANDRYAVGKLGSTNRADFESKIDQKITRLCTALKARGVEIYTITFRVTDPKINAVYRDCATDTDHFATAADNTAILNVFEKIGRELKRLRIVA